MQFRVANELSSLIQIGLVTLRSEIRETIDNDLQLVMYVGLIASSSILLFGVTGQPGAYQFGLSLHTKMTLPVSETITKTVTSVWVFGVLLFSFVAATEQESVDPEFLLLNSSKWTFRLGRPIARFLKYGDWVILFTIIASVLFGAGARSPLAVVTLVIGTLLTFFGAALFGGLIGSSVNYVSNRVRSFNRIKYVLLIVILVSYYLLILERQHLYGYFLNSPISWYSNLLLLGVPNVHANLATGVTAFIATVVMIPLLTYAEHRIFLSTRESGDGSVAKEAQTGATTSTLRENATIVPVSDRLWGLIKRLGIQTIRRPRSAIFVMVGPSVGYVLFTNVLSGYADGIPITVIVALSITAGAGPTLNLIGNEYEILPYHLTTPDGVKSIVRSYILGTSAVSIPLTVIALTVLVFTHRMNWLMIGPGITLIATAPLISLASGILFPGYSKAKQGERTNFIPNMLALIFYIGSVSLVVLPMVVGVLQPDTFVQFVRLVPRQSTGVVGAGMTFVLSLLTANACYHFSIEQTRERYVETVLE